MEVTVFKNKMHRLGEGSSVKLFKWQLQIHNDNEEESLLPSFPSSAYRPSHLPGTGCHTWQEPFPTQTPASVPAFTFAWCWVSHLTGTSPYPNTCITPDGNPALPKHLHCTWREPFPTQTPAPHLMRTLSYPNTRTIPDGNPSLPKHLYLRCSLLPSRLWANHKCSVR